MSKEADLYKLIQNIEYENQQYLRLIEQENQQIEAIESDFQVKSDQTKRLQDEISQLDENTKRAHKQFIHNRDNVESLKKTIDVLKDHESALEKTLKNVQDQANLKRKEQAAMLQHYRDIWNDYEEKYKTFPLAKELEVKKERVRVLQNEVQQYEVKMKDLQRQINEFNNHHDVDFRDMKKLIIKIANLRTNTNKTERAIKQAYKEKREIEEQMKKAQEKKRLQEEAARQEQVKLNERTEEMELQEQSASDSGDASTLISMVNDDATEETVSPQVLESLVDNLASIQTEISTSRSEKMETDIADPQQVQIEIQSNKTKQVSQPQPVFSKPAPPSSFTSLTSHIPQISCQNFTRPYSLQVPTRQIAPGQATFSNQNNVQRPGPIRTSVQSTRPVVPQVTQQQPRTTVQVPQYGVRPTGVPFNRTQRPTTPQTAQQFSRPGPQQFSRPTPQQFTRPNIPCTSVPSQVRPTPQYGPRPSVPQVSQPKPSQSPQFINYSRSPQIQPNTRPSVSQMRVPQIHQSPNPVARVTRPAPPSIPRLPVTDQVKKMQVSANTVSQASSQSPRIDQSSPKTNDFNSPNLYGNNDQQVLDVNGNPISPETLKYPETPKTQRIPKTPKTPEGTEVVLDSDYSPFDMEKHRRNLQLLNKSPGQPLIEPRPMFSADKVEASKESSGIFTGFQTMNMFDNVPNKTSSKGDTSISTEMSVMNPANTEPNKENQIPNKQTNTFFGGATSMFCSPDIGVGNSSGFSFGGGGGDTGGSSIMSLFGSSSTGDQSQETSFSFSFGRSETGGEKSGFSFGGGGGGGDTGGSSIMSLFGSSSPGDQQQQESSFSFSFN